MSEVARVTHVVAEFGGQERRFELSHQTLEYFELVIGGGETALVAFKRLTAQEASIRTVRHILERGLTCGSRLPPGEAARIVDEAMSAKPAAAYLVLASRILFAALFGMAEGTEDAAVEEAPDAAS
jgi:hypothetical protein